MKSGVVHFHSGCFDGVISAVIASDFLAAHAGWREIEYRALDYSVGPSWTSTALPPGSAVVDFLFHPGALLWADHHATTFGPGVAPPAESRPWWFYDPAAPSCAGVLLAGLPPEFRRLDRHRELARWADKIDSARYQSVEEALYSSDPAMLLHAALGTRRGRELAPAMIAELRRSPMDEVVLGAGVREEVEIARDALRLAVDTVRQQLRMAGGQIAVYEVEALPDAPSARYAPYTVFPQARYSIGLVYSERGPKLTMMRNPWKSFRGVHLGHLLEAFGGGGHERVAALQLGPGKRAEAHQLLGQLLTELQRRDRGPELSPLSP